MGVAGLWEVLRPAGQVRSLTDLAVEDGFNANPSHQRGFRIGIDASIWFFHATYGREGENPELRTLFFRCCRLLQSPLLPLFVFDGQNRPAIKRGKRVGGNAHWLTQGMKNIIDAFGFEWWVAPGEAEAELAYLNRVGVIDAVLSDDVDNFLFGATMVIRNPSSTLSGNRAHPVKNGQGKDDGNHVVTYTADAILSDPSIALSRPGAILIGLLSGGDYIPAGLPGCGQKFATALARAGFGDSLVKAIEEVKGARLDAFLDQWRQDIRNELKTNKSGLLPSRKPSLAASLPDDFPSLPVLMSYVDPLISENTPRKGKPKTPLGVWRNDPDPMRIASLCELYFEWGVKDVIVHRFRTVLWPGIVCRAVRRVVMDEDTRRRSALGGVCHFASGEDDDDSITGSSSPTKRISSALSALTLSSPSKKSSASGTSTSNTPGSESFTLSSLVPLTTPASPSSSRSVSPSSPTSSASSPSPLLLEILSQRIHASTDSTLEYRVLVDPITLVKRAESGVKGLRPPLVGRLFGVDPEDEDEDADESGSDNTIERLETAAGAASKSGTKKRKARRENPTTPLRLWLPACMLRAAAPALAEAYEEKVRVREEKKAKRGTRERRGGRAAAGVHLTSRRAKVKDVAGDDGDESVPGPSSSKTIAGSKTKTKAVRIGGGGGRRKLKQVSQAQDDAYEFIDLSAGESPCSSNGEGVRENAKGKGKAKTKQTNAKSTTKASAKVNVTNGGATTTNTMKEFFNTTEPYTMRTTKSKLSTSRSSVAKASTLNPAASKRVYEEEEEDSADVAVPPPLPKSSRPLDLLRAKPKSGTTVLNPTSKSSKTKVTAIPRHEEEESSPGSPPSRPFGSRPNVSSLPCRLAQPAPQARKKPLFVDVSDTDSDIEVSDVRRPLSGTTAAIAAYHEAEGKTGVGNGDMSVSVGVGKTLSTSASEKSTSGAVGGVINLIAKGNASKSKSTPSMFMSTALRPPVRPVSAPLDTGTIGPMLVARSPSKLAHILLPQSALESQEEEEGSEGDELPTFHRGSAKLRTKRTSATTARPAPRPFPMQIAPKSPVSPSALRLRGRDRSRYDDENNDGDMVEIVDVFTIPRRPSPPRSPTPSPSPVHASVGSATFVQPKQSSEFPTSPTNSKSQTDIEPHNKTKQRYHVSSDRDTHASGNETNGTLKSPRKSAAHSSPRHVVHVRGRSSSPTPLTCHPALHAKNVTLWTDDTEGYNVSDSRQPRPEDCGSTRIGHDIGRKPQPSDASAIYISSGSEDEGDAGLGIDNGVGDGETGINEEQDAYTDLDADGWANTGMLLSAPPSPAHAILPPASDPVPTVPTVKVALPNPARVSKFKPAPVAASKLDVRAPPAECHVSDRTPSTSLKGWTNDDVTPPQPVHRAPLLAARARRSKGRDDIIDLTSD